MNVHYSCAYNYIVSFDKENEQTKRMSVKCVFILYFSLDIIYFIVSTLI